MTSLSRSPPSPGLAWVCFVIISVLLAVVRVLWLHWHAGFTNASGLMSVSLSGGSSKTDGCEFKDSCLCLERLCDCVSLFMPRIIPMSIPCSAILVCAVFGLQGHPCRHCVICYLGASFRCSAFGSKVTDNESYQVAAHLHTVQEVILQQPVCPGQGGPLGERGIYLWCNSDNETKREHFTVFYCKVITFLKMCSNY